LEDFLQVLAKKPTSFELSLLRVDENHNIISYLISPIKVANVMLI
jgi:hypothetical protein